LRLQNTRQKSDPWDFLRLLRLGWKAKRKEHGEKSKTKDTGLFTTPCCRVPVACFHLITLSALTSTFGGIVSPICLAVFSMITSSNFFVCSSCKPTGFAPLSILSTYTAARLYKSV